MGTKSQALVQSVIALALVAAWYGSARADLRIALQSSAAAAPGFEDASSYCFQSQADGCWPQATPDTQQPATMRIDDR